MYTVYLKKVGKNVLLEPRLRGDKFRDRNPAQTLEPNQEKEVTSWLPWNFRKLQTLLQKENF